MSLLGHLYTPGEARGASILGTKAYVADGTAGLAIVDLATPKSPVLIGQADTPDDARSVTVDEGFAYVADSGSGIQVIDISNPHSPRLVGGTYPGIGQTNQHNTYASGSAVEMATTAEAICVAAGRGGLRLYPRQCGITTGIAVPGLHADAVSLARVAPTSNPATVPVRLVIEPTPRYALVTIYDSTGRLVRRIRVDPRASGAQAVIWDGCDSTGKAMSNGTYYLRLEGDAGRATGRVVLLR
jgi:flagellar hook capping protein FlgD/LVIVD repeat-containing protein